jgi:hypothetical protein
MMTGFGLFIVVFTASAALVGWLRRAPAGSPKPMTS